MKTWAYNGTQSGYKTQVQRYPDGDIVIYQTRDGGLPFLPENCVAVRFNERDLLRILKKGKQHPRKKSKRGKK